jgi:hypothetical protein
MEVLARMWGDWSSVYLLMECKLIQSLWRTVRQFLKKLNQELPYDPAIPLLHIYTQKNWKQVCKQDFVKCSDQHYL